MLGHAPAIDAAEQHFGRHATKLGGVRSMPPRPAGNGGNGRIVAGTDDSEIFRNPDATHPGHVDEWHGVEIDRPQKTAHGRSGMARSLPLFPHSGPRATGGMGGLMRPCNPKRFVASR